MMNCLYKQRRLERQRKARLRQKLQKAGATSLWDEVVGVWGWNQRFNTVQRTRYLNRTEGVRTMLGLEHSPRTAMILGAVFSGGDAMGLAKQLADQEAQQCDVQSVAATPIIIDLLGDASEASREFQQTVVYKEECNVC